MVRRFSSVPGADGTALAVRAQRCAGGPKIGFRRLVRLGDLSAAAGRRSASPTSATTNRGAPRGQIAADRDPEAERPEFQTPPIDQRTPINVLAVRTEDSSPSARSIGRSVAIRASSKSGIPVSGAPRSQLQSRMAVVLHPVIVEMLAEPAAPFAVNGHPAPDSRQRDSQAGRCERNKGHAPARSAPSAFFCSIALNRSRLQKFSRY